MNDSEYCRYLTKMVFQRAPQILNLLIITLSTHSIVILSLLSSWLKACIQSSSTGLSTLSVLSCEMRLPILLLCCVQLMLTVRHQNFTTTYSMDNGNLPWIMVNKPCLQQCASNCSFSITETKNFTETA